MTNGYSLGDDALARRLDDRLAAVEVMLRESVKSDYPFVTETSRHLVDAGGKRFRPMLVLLAAEFGDAARPSARSRKKNRRTSRSTIALRAQQVAATTTPH